MEISIIKKLILQDKALMKRMSRKLPCIVKTTELFEIKAKKGLLSKRPVPYAQFNG